MIDVVYYKIAAEDLPYNPDLKQSDIGRYGVAQKGFRRFVEVCDAESDANDVVDAVMHYQQENSSETNSFL
jgi:hypothetical protein